MSLPFDVSAETMRRIEWWALLNCHARPSDLPRGTNQEALFAELTREIPRQQQRMEFWTGAFGCGRHKHRYI